MIGQIEITKWESDRDKLLSNWRLKGMYDWHLNYGDGIVLCNGHYSKLKPVLKEIKEFLSIINIPVEVRARHSGHFLIEGELLFTSKGKPK